MRPLISAVLCSLLLAANTPLASHADDASDASAPEVALAAPQPPPQAQSQPQPGLQTQPQPQSAAQPLAVAAPRAAGQFVYGTHIGALDHAQLASTDGFKLMWAYVPWQQVEPERGTFLFRKQDNGGSRSPMRFRMWSAPPRPPT